MQIIHSFTELPKTEKFVLGLGFFDGCHRGHQAVFAAVKKMAEEKGALPGVLTFYPHPMTVLAPEVHVPLLQSLPERLASFEAADMKLALVVKPDREFLSITAGDFLHTLSALPGLTGVVCGPNFTFGRGALGHAEMLAAACPDAHVVPLQEMDGTVPSSTAIRTLLQKGNVKDAACLLGRPYSLSGDVVHGFRRGHDVLGFPTANLEPEENRVVPADGVYATFAVVNGKHYPAVTNVGTNPTFGNTARTIETFIFHFDQSLYGKPFTLEWIDRLRGEITFPDADALAVQIKKDIGNADNILEMYSL